MPIGPVPEGYHRILESTAVGHLATIGRHGEPQVTPVWFLWDGEHVLLNVKAETVKYRNVLHDRRVAISIPDPENPMHYVEVRGEVTTIELYRDLSFVNLLARKYTGHDMPASEDGKERYKLTVRVESWTGQ